MKPSVLMILPYFLLFLDVVHGATVIPFSSPENSFDALGFFIDACPGADIASYTITSEKIASALSGNRILIEKSPVGGIPDNYLLCQLGKINEVRLYDGPLRYMHAKYAVCGNLSLVSSENLGDRSYPAEGRGSKGWGAIIEDDATAEELSDIFEEDWSNSMPLHEECEYLEKGKINYDISRLEIYTNQEVSFVKSPLRELLSLVDSAESRLLIQQLYIYRHFGQEDNPLLLAVMNATGRTEVKVMLDSNFYSIDPEDRQSNYHSCKFLENATGCIFTDKYSIIHNKGVVSDDRALVSSINWNQNSIENNREVGLIIEGSASEYYARDFLKELPMRTEERNKIPESVVFIVMALTAWFLIRKRR